MKFCKHCSTLLVLGENWTEARKKHSMNSCNGCNHDKSKLWKESNKEKASLSQKKTKLKSTYGISLEDYNTLFTKQKGGCAICGKHQSSFARALAVDHNHTTGQVRGLLCSNCNTAIGKLKESPYILEKAILYLKEFNNEN